ncbi:MAG: GPW/gp25 family protein [Desulfovibrionaceae bacterium]|nr:GPW/gp25 family protein [Desulfovibrionaceae bacterium]MBF0513619.1 GPW/gp25 family protein [Desulfovibrionaceae bacterium]
MPIDVTTITSADWSPQVGAPGEIVEQLADIAQAMRIVLTTPKGSDPHRPDFGCEAWRYLDYPVSVSAPNIIREATDAVKKWEPRATLKRVTCVVDGSTVALTLKWVATLGQVQTTEVRYALSSAS